MKNQKVDIVQTKYFNSKQYFLKKIKDNKVTVLSENVYSSRRNDDDVHIC